MSLRLFLACLLGLGAGLAGYFYAGNEATLRAGVESDPTRARERPATELSPLAALPKSRDPDQLDPAVAAALGAGLAIGLDDPIAALASLLDIDDEVVRSEASFELVSRMNGAQLRDLITRVANAGEESPEFEMVEELFDDIFTPVAMFDRWAELDPNGIAEFALSPIPEALKDSVEINLALRGLALAFVAQRDPDGAFEIVDSMRDSDLFGDLGEKGVEFLGMFLGMGIAIADPVASIKISREKELGADAITDGPVFELAGPHAEAMLAEVMEFPEGDERDEMLGELYEGWGAYDLEAALASASAMPEGELRDELLDDAFDGAAKADPRAAAAALDLLPEGEARESLAGKIVSRWAWTEPAAALEWARDHLPDDAFAAQLQKAASRLQVEDGVNFVAGLSDVARKQFFASGTLGGGHFVVRMARQDPQAALKFLTKAGGIDFAIRMGSSFADAAVTGGIEQAMAAADTLPEGEFHDDYVRTVAFNAGREGGADALAWAGQEGENARANAMLGWASENPIAATKFASNEAPDLVGKAVAGWAAADAESAYRWTVENHQGDPQAIANVLAQSDLLSHWGRQDPAGAAQAMLGFPGEIGEDALASVIGPWAGSEPSRASKFVAQHLEDGPMRDAAVTALVRKIKINSPEEARVWAESIGDAAVRAAALEGFEAGSE